MRRNPVYWCGPRLLAAGRLTEARAQAERFLRRDAEHLGALEVLCQVHIRLGNPEQALNALRKLVRLNPTEVGYELLRASALEQLGHWQQALEVLTLAHSRARVNRQQEQIEREIDSLMQSMVAESKEGVPMEVLSRRAPRRTAVGSVIN